MSEWTIPRWDRWQRLFFWIAIGGVIISILLACYTKDGFSTAALAAPFDAGNSIKVLQAAVLCIWLVAPPTWFWFDYFYIYLKIRDKRKPALDSYKHGVDVQSKLWIAFVTVLLGLYFGKDFARNTSPPASSNPPVVQQSQPQTSPVNPAVPPH